MPLGPSFSLNDPEWLAHRHIENERAFRYIHVPRADRSQVPFLTDACLGDRSGMRSRPLTESLTELEQGPLCWLFHSAFCGSTLLAHAFDLPGISSFLSEPVLLNDLVGLRRRGAKPREVARTADAVLRALGRHFPGEQAVVVKPSNVANPLAELFMALQQTAPAIFLFAPLETFLISVVRKGLSCRLWVRELLEGYLREDFINLGFAGGDYFRQSDLQIAAVGWLAQHAYFARLASKLGAGRVRFLDADHMVEHPHETISAVASHFRLWLDDAGIDAVVQGPAFNRHSKSGTAYSAEMRRADYVKARAAHEEEIGAVLLWAQAVADNAGVILTPSSHHLP